MKTSFQQYRRLGTVGYAQWLCAVNDVQFNDEMITLTDRDSIERYVSSVLSPVQDTPAPLLDKEPINPFNEDLTKYDSLTVAELRALCKERGLPVYGTKAQIVLRLKQDDEGIIPEEEPESPVVETALEGDSEAPTEEVAASVGEELNEQTKDSDEQEPVIEE